MALHIYHIFSALNIQHGGYMYVRNTSLIIVIYIIIIIIIIIMLWKELENV